MPRLLGSCYVYTFADWDGFDHFKLLHMYHCNSQSGWLCVCVCVGGDAKLRLCRCSIDVTPAHHEAVRFLFANRILDFQSIVGLPTDFFIFLLLIVTWQMH